MNEKQFQWCVSALIVLAAFVAYANTLTNDFVWDDASSVLLHKHVQDPSKVLQLFAEDQHAFGRGQGNFYRPLVSLSFMIEYWLSKPSPAVQGDYPTLQILSPFVFHLSNTLWHALVALLLFRLLSILAAPRFVRVLAPLLYVVHPLHTEAIAYISGRADPMAGAFFLAALCSALSVRSKLPWLWSGVFFAAALLCKESAIIFPVILLLAAVTLRNTPQLESDIPRRSIVPSIVASGIVVGTYGALRWTLLSFSQGGEVSVASLGRRFSDAGQAFALYLKLLFVPTGLHMERTLNGVSGSMALVGWVLIVLFLIVFVACFFAKNPRLAFAIGLFLVTWFPISGIFPLNAPMAEHWMYLPMLGFTWALLEIIWMLVGATPLRYPTYAAGYAALLALVLVTTERNHDWRTNQALYTATLAKNPDSIRVNYNLGVTYEDLLGNLSGARRHFEKVLDLYAQRKAEDAAPGATDVIYEEEMEAHLSLAQIFQREKLPDNAAVHYETLRRLNVTEGNTAVISRAYINYANLLAEAGRVDDATKLLKEGADRIPSLKEQVDSMLNRRPGADATATQAEQTLPPPTPATP